MQASADSGHAAAASPLAPRLVLSVGITGHRGGARLPDAAIPRVREQAHGILAAVRAATLRLPAQGAAIYGPSEPRFRLVSALAEGADQFAVEAADGFELDVVLPFAAERYETDFSTPEARGRFRRLLAEAGPRVFALDRPRGEDSDPAAYEAVGRLMLDQSDLVLAVWDGKPSHLRGGTAQIVAEAVGSGAPVVWIHSLDESAPPALWDGRERIALGGLDRGAHPALDALVARLLLPAAAGDAAGHGHGEAAAAPVDLLNRFYGEDCAATLRPQWRPGGAFGAIYGRFQRVMARGAHALAPAAQAIAPASPAPPADDDWRALRASLPACGALKSDLETILEPRWRVADRLAIHYANLYRSAWLTILSLAPLAVIVSVIPVFAWESTSLKVFCAAIEALLLLAIIGVIRIGRRQDWHRRFLDLRQLAELLRQSRILACIGCSGRGAGPASDDGDQGDRWTAFYARATLRELSLPEAVCDSAYLDAVAAAANAHEIDGQIAYNLRTRARLHRIEERLEAWGENLFAATLWLAGAIVFFGLLLIGAEHGLFGGRLAEISGHDGWLHHFVVERIKPLTTVFAVSMPALGGAFAALRVQGEFKVVAERSGATARALSAVRARLAGGPSARNFPETRGLLLEAAEAMQGDLGAWRLIHRLKPLAKPS